MIGKHCYCFWSRAVEGIRENRARAGVRRDYSMGLESMSAITSFLNQSQKQQGRRRINHVLLQDNRGSRPFSDIYIKGFPVCTSCDFLSFITFILTNENSRVKGILAHML